VPRVVTPSPEKDRVQSGVVGVVAVVGFVVGVAWPRLLGVKVGPDVPTPGTGRPIAAAEKTPQAGSSAPASSASTSPSATGGAPSDEEPSATNQQRVVVSPGKVTSCRNKKSEKVDECGKVAFDELAKKHLDELARCPSAIGLEGVVTVAVELNFEKNQLDVQGVKKKSDVPSSTLNGVVRCAGDAFKTLELEGIPHTHLRYTLHYELSFYPPGKEPPAPVDPGAPPADADPGLGTATVQWEKALIRETPDEGKVVARLPQGTRVKLLEQKDDWYRIESSKAKGWVYRQAIGK
jgi:hypothetical protein